jgi:hypothetical protein
VIRQASRAPLNLIFAKAMMPGEAVKTEKGKPRNLASSS